MSYRLGIDIGGTFTDAILWDDAGGAPRIAKVPSTPHDPSEGFLAAARQIVNAAGLTSGEVELIVHGTTVATNAIIEGKTARTAFVTTRGFRDLLEIQRQIRPSLYDLQFEKPPPLVPRNLCFEVAERLDAGGAVLQPLDETDVQRIADALRQAGVASVAVCFLHAYRNPAHEQRAGAVLRAALPRASVSLSSEVAPEFREYFRASTTVVNAAVRPVVERYLSAIEQRLQADGFSAPLLVMQSNGGVLRAANARERPVFMVESGPAAGVIAATYLAECLGRRDVMAFDMGGTTAKAGLVRDGAPTITKDYEVGARAGAGTGAARGSGYPIRTPVIDLVEIGAGGGSIAWVDSGGALRVGPQSAGADPGPVCYGRGGTEPTVTDANLVLGRLPAESPIAAGLRLDVGPARAALEGLGIGNAEEAAAGVVAVAVNAMVQALRVVSVERGHDPAAAELIAFGGAGPLHACELADQLGATRVICLPASGVLSALGLAAAERRRDASRSLLRPLADLDALEGAAADLVRPRDGEELRAAADLRYAGQSFELLIPFADGDLAEAFHREHERRYGHSDRDRAVELVTLRAAAVRPGADVHLAATGDAERSRRKIHWDGDRIEALVLAGSGLRPGTEIEGPAV